MNKKKHKQNKKSNLSKIQILISDVLILIQNMEQKGKNENIKEYLVIQFIEERLD